MTDKAPIGQLLEQVAHLTDKVKEFDALELENERAVAHVSELGQRLSMCEGPKEQWQ